MVQGSLALTGLTGLGDRTDRSGEVTASSRPDRSALTALTASFWMAGIYTPWSPLAWGASSLAILELLETFS